MQDLSASFRSNVVKNDDYLFEIISVQIYNTADKAQYASVVLCREAETQCFNVDEEGKTMLEPDDWSLRSVDCSATNPQEVSRLVNGTIVDLVQDHNVKDVPSSSELVKGFRKVYNHQFAGTCVMSNITHIKVNLQHFWSELHSLIGEQGDFNSVKGIITRKLPLTDLRKFSDEPQPKSEELPTRQYALWGVYS